MCSDLNSTKPDRSKVVCIATDGPVLNFIGIKAKDPANSVAFYKMLGLEFVLHRHGAGLEHYAAEYLTFVLEIHAAQSNEDVRNRVRIGFQVRNLFDLCASLAQNGAHILSRPKSSSWGLRMIVLDPDENRVELFENIDVTVER